MCKHYYIYILRSKSLKKQKVSFIQDHFWTYFYIQNMDTNTKHHIYIKYINSLEHYILFVVVILQTLLFLKVKGYIGKIFFSFLIKLI